MFTIWDSSNAIKSINIKLLQAKSREIVFKLKQGKLKSWPMTRANHCPYPFSSLSVGKSFHLAYAECSKQEIAYCLALMARYNRSYAVWFKAWPHKHCANPGVEIARIF